MGDKDKTMRIDKWLWSIRAYKTRSIAAEACKHNKVLIGGTPVKPAREVKIGDVVEIKKMPVIYSFRVLAYLGSRVGAKNVPEYADNLTPQSELDKLTFHVSPAMSRDKGTGRPTKKDRREIDSLMEEFFFDDGE